MFILQKAGLIPPNMPALFFLRIGMKQKIIVHVDGNNFFAGCEILMNPSLKGKPVCVLSNNDGCVIARSNEAKKLGIPMGIPHFMAKKQFQGVTYLSSDFTLYHEISQRMMQLLQRYSDIVEVYSIDEAFLDMTGMKKMFNLEYQDLAKKIKYDIENEIGITVSVGIAPSKMLAKLATHKAKALNGTYVIEKESAPYELENIKTEDIWGIGRNISRSLRRYGIFYAHEILLKDDNFYKKNYGKKGMELKYELSGISVIPVTAGVQKPKSIQRTRAFPEFSKDKSYIKTELTMHLHNVCKKLRDNELCTSYISVMLRTKDFKVFYLDKKLENKTFSEVLLIKEVENLFNKIYKDGIIYRSSGVMAFGLDDTSKAQLSLFNENKNEKYKKISYLIDKIEDKFGSGVLCAGDTGIKSLREKHKREMRFRSF